MATTSTLDKIKVWAFPGMMSILAAIIWQDVKEIKSDVKALVAQSNQDKVRIDNLERVVYGKTETAFQLPVKQPERIPRPSFTEFVMIKPEDHVLTGKKPVAKPTML